MATPQSTLRSLPRRSIPIRDYVTEEQRALELSRARERTLRLAEELPKLIEEQVGKHIQELEDKLVRNFRDIGEKVVDESTSALNNELDIRIESLEQISQTQTQTLAALRDSRHAADRKVDNVLDDIERAIASALPGFRLEPAADALQTSGKRIALASDQIYGSPVRDQFCLDVSTSLIRSGTREIGESQDRAGFCPSCTSTDVRRSRRSGLFQEFLRLFFIAPFRCRACRHKFYRF